MILNKQVNLFLEKIEKNAETEDALIQTVRKWLANDRWRLVREGPWFVAYSKKGTRENQGWKIHLSATHLSAVEILNNVLPILSREECSFKICNTLRTLSIMNESHYPRGYSGKFMTIYPDDDEQFARIVEQCDSATKGMRGPAILSDKAYKKGSIVHYRYGAFKNINGKDGEPCIYDPSGNLVPDHRNAWYVKPDWVADPFGDSAPTDKEPFRCKYTFEKAIRHANKGGVYIGKSLESGEKVAIKEARPHVATDDNGYDATDFLKNEANVLQKLAGTNAVPAYIDLFTLGDHCFLVQEYLEGQALRKYIVDIHKSMKKAERDPLLYTLASELTTIVAVCHREGIHIRDLSPNNIIVLNNGSIKLIDLEYAKLSDDDRILAPTMHTPGYSIKEKNGTNPRLVDDLFSLGCMLYFIFSGNDPYYIQDDSNFDKSRTSAEKIRDCVMFAEGEKWIEPRIARVIVGLTAEKPDQRLSLSETSALLKSRGTSVEFRAQPIYDNTLLQPCLEDITSSLLDSLELDSDTRLLPASSFGETTSPINIQSGMAGVGMFLNGLVQAGSLDKALLQNIVQWTLAKVEQVDTPADKEYPGKEFSLYFGDYGAAWFLTDAAVALEDSNLSETITKKALALPSTSSMMDIVLGTAGYGMANLHSWSVTKNTLFLDKAIQAANHICDHYQKTAEGISWPLKGETFWGYAHGNAGICHFILLMYKITNNSMYLDVLEQGTKELIRHSLMDGEECSWNFGPGNNRNWPYWCNGTSGIGSYLIRLYHVLQDRAYLRLAEMAANNVMARSWDHALCQCHGLSGNAEFLLDMHQFTKDLKYLRMANQLAHHIFVHRTCKKGKDVFADESGSRISFDYGTGMTGIAAFYQRLLNKSNRLFMNDELILNE